MGHLPALPLFVALSLSISRVVSTALHIFANPLSFSLVGGLLSVVPLRG